MIGHAHVVCSLLVVKGRKSEVRDGFKSDDVQSILGKVGTSGASDWLVPLRCLPELRWLVIHSTSPHLQRQPTALVPDSRLYLAASIRFN